MKKRKVCDLLSLVLSMSMVGACSHESAARNSGAPLPGSVPASAMLALHGFNYTDLTISYFAVNGIGGGNIFVSSPSTGGGKTSCCVAWNSGTPLPTSVHVEWMRVVDNRDRWCEKTVPLAGPVPAAPSHLSVHFMPDGDIQADITAGYPSPKLRLENFSDGRRKAAGNVIHDEEVARCRYER